MIAALKGTASSFLSQLSLYPLYSILYLATVKKDMVRDARPVYMLCGGENSRCLLPLVLLVVIQLKIVQDRWLMLKC